MTIGTVLLIAIVFFSVISHEIAHGYMALRLGDPTARQMGRLTFNPLPHIDILGTIILPLFLVLSGSTILFAWAKPVPVNPAYFRSPKKGMMWVAIAGPATNLFIALLLTAVLHSIGKSIPDVFARALLMGVIVNLALMVFNTLPIPPLDGSKVVARFLTGDAFRSYLQLERYGMFIVIILLYFGVIRKILLPVVVGAIELLGLEGFAPLLHAR